MKNCFDSDAYCVTTSKWFPNLIQQAYCKFLEICFLYTFCRPNNIRKYNQKYLSY